ncbi:MAG: enoyl-CoA hydratase [Candidatus Dormibacteraceae bacterium]
MEVAFENLTVTDALPAAVVTLNRPERRNALSMPLMIELRRTLEEQSGRAEVRAFVLRAEGRAFSAGHDLSELTGRTLEDEQRIFRACSDLMETIQRLPQPVVAAVQGVATAAGCQLVATCDLALASESATFATPGVKIGLFCSTPMVAVSRAIGRKRALYMLLSGRPIDARTAAAWGLVNDVVPAGELDRAALEMATQIAAASPLTLAIGKRAFYEQIDVTQPEAYRLMSQTMAENAMACDAQEGMSAFLEKREPTWTGR